jgi:hypothetical protein
MVSIVCRTNVYVKQVRIEERWRELKEMSHSETDSSLASLKFIRSHVLFASVNMLYKLNKNKQDRESMSACTANKIIPQKDTDIRAQVFSVIRTWIWKCYLDEFVVHEGPYIIYCTPESPAKSVTSPSNDISCWCVWIMFPVLLAPEPFAFSSAV